ncbi:hypothetical protein BpHYR1_024897 [Brachionus plicatilis]|uniref:Uncharacterized protein n=1 Tax=Brachionus plicatilis TaxID=10195 RepID=A0A3M7Q9N0_BRAPC|nr:hypothetical protein BpHYR1_024897 [Brachionus plicatilis]
MANLTRTIQKFSVLYLLYTKKVNDKLFDNIHTFPKIYFNFRSSFYIFEEKKIFSEKKNFQILYSNNHQKIFRSSFSFSECNNMLLMALNKKFEVKIIDDLNEVSFRFSFQASQFILFTFKQSGFKIISLMNDWNKSQFKFRMILEQFYILPKLARAWKNN